MTPEQWNEIYKEMKSLLLKDRTLTHIDVCFQIQKVTTEPKRARINIKTFKDETKKSNKR